jgi:hypothetical protein
MSITPEALLGSLMRAIVPAACFFVDGFIDALERSDSY